MPGQSVQLQNYLREVSEALRANDMERALRVADAAISDGHEHPNLLVLASHSRMNGGDNERALALALRARALTPRSADVLNAQGLCLIKLERPREAVAVFDAALRAAPAMAALRYHKAQAYEALGELDAARRELDRVVAIVPDHVEALAWLATLASQRGDSLTARDFANRALAISPKLHAAHLALAAADVAEKNYAGAIARLRPLLDGFEISPINRSVAEGLMGDALDGEDRRAEAFAAYTASKATLRSHYAPVYDIGKFESAAARVNRLTRYFREADASPWRSGPDTDDDAQVHAFLVGFPRSGTTLLEQVLASHPSIETMEERDALWDAAKEFTMADEGFARLAEISPDEAERFRDAYWKTAGEFGHAADKPVFLDKMPLNTVMLPVIAKLFPAAKIIFALRDPRDVVLSCFRRRFGITAQMFELTTLQSAAAYYDAVMTLADLYRGVFTLDLTETKHETLLDDFEGETRRLCGFLGVEWRDEMKNFASRTRTSTTPSGAQVARGLSREGADQWRRYEEQLAPVLPVLAPWVTRFGYPEN